MERKPYNPNLLNILYAQLLFLWAKTLKHKQKLAQVLDVHF